MPEKDNLTKSEKVRNITDTRLKEIAKYKGETIDDAVTLLLYCFQNPNKRKYTEETIGSRTITPKISEAEELELIFKLKKTYLRAKIEQSEQEKELQLKKLYEESLETTEKHEQQAKQELEEAEKIRKES